MRTLKYTVSITVEVLSLKAAPTIISTVASAMSEEIPSGEITFTAGETACWSVKSEPVSF